MSLIHFKSVYINHFFRFIKRKFFITLVLCRIYKFNTCKTKVSLNLFFVYDDYLKHQNQGGTNKT
jgi:hypothetical protein